MAWLSDPEDKQVLQKIHECMGLYYAKLSGQVKETVTGFSVCFRDIRESIDIGVVLSHLVELTSPHIHDIAVFWENEESTSINIELYSTKKLPQAAYPQYSPVISIPMELQQSLEENGFDIRQAPPSWPILYPMIEQLCKIIYSRGSDISVPQISLLTERSQSSAWIEIGNMDAITYSFLEYLTSCIPIKNIVAEFENNALYFEIPDDNIGIKMAVRNR